MADGARVGVVIVVPAFAKGQERDPPVVGGIIGGRKAATAPGVGGRVDQPGAMQFHCGSQEDAPSHEAGGQEYAAADGAPHSESARKHE